MPRPVPAPTSPGQESVWDYPRPPRVEPSSETVEVWLGGERIAAHDHDRGGCWRPATRRPTTCPATPSSTEPCVLRRVVVVRVEGRGLLPRPGGRGRGRPAGRLVLRRARRRGFVVITDAVAVMPGLVDRCVVDGEVVRPQEGGFYGGWITDRVVGPFKGGPGSHGW